MLRLAHPNLKKNHRPATNHPQKSCALCLLDIILYSQKSAFFSSFFSSLPMGGWNGVIILFCLRGGEGMLRLEAVFRVVEE